MDQVYTNMPEYIRTEITHLRFVEFRVVLNRQGGSLYMRECGWRSPVQTEHCERSVITNKVKIVPLRPTYDGRQIRAILIPFLKPVHI